MVITTNGSHKLPRPFQGVGGARSSVSISGVADGAVCKFTYYNSENTEVDLTGGAITIPDQYVIEHGSDAHPDGTSQKYINVSSAGASTNIVVDVSSLS